MSTVVIALGCRFQIHSDDHGIPHCHIVGHGCEMKVGLIDFQVLDDTSFSERDAGRLIEIVKRYQSELMSKWEKYHGQEEKN